MVRAGGRLSAGLEEIAQWLDYGYRNSEAGLPAPNAFPWGSQLHSTASEHRRTDCSTSYVQQTYNFKGGPSSWL